MVKYPNAAKGMTWLFNGEVALLCYSLVEAIRAFSNEPNQLIDVLLIISQLAALAFCVVGVFKLARDCPEAKKAVWIEVVAIVVSLVAGIGMLMSGMADTDSNMATYLAFGVELLDLMALNLILKGSGRLCNEMGGADVEKYGHGVWTLKVIAFIFSLCTGVLLAVFLIAGGMGEAGGSTGLMITGGVFGIIGLLLAIAVCVMEIIASVKYVLYLNKAKKCLNA